MKKMIFTLICILGLSSLLFAASIQTTFAGGNGQSGNMFEINALQNVVINSFAGNLNPATQTVNIYYRIGTWVGYENNSAAWTLIGTTSVTSTANGIPTEIPIAINLAMSAGSTYAFYVQTSGGVAYTNGTSAGAVYVADSYLQIEEGVGVEGSFATTFSPRVWNGIVNYTPGTVIPEPSTLFLGILGLFSLLSFKKFRI